MIDHPHGFSSMNRLPIRFLFLLVLLFITACDRTETVSSKKPETGPGKTCLIGLIPEQNIFKQMERYQPLADYLSREVSVAIRLTVLSRYGNIVDNFVSSGMDGAFFGSFTYALAHEKLGVEALARPVSLKGISTYHGLIFVKKDRGITSIREMQGKRFAFVDKATTAGYLLPLAYFKEHGKNYRSFLKETYFTGTHEDAIYDVLNRKAAIGAAKNTVYDRLAASDERIKRDLVILARSPDVPENALAVRKDLEDPLKKSLKAALLTMHEKPEGTALLKVFGAARFIETNDSDYQPVYRYAQEIGLNLVTYDYMNE